MIDNDTNPYLDVETVQEWAKPALEADQAQ